MSLLSEEAIECYFKKGSLWKFKWEFNTRYYIVKHVEDDYVSVLTIDAPHKEPVITSITVQQIHIGNFVEKFTYVEEDCSYLNNSLLQVSIDVRQL